MDNTKDDFRHEFWAEECARYGDQSVGELFRAQGWATTSQVVSGMPCAILTGSLNGITRRVALFPRYKIAMQFREAVIGSADLLLFHTDLLSGDPAPQSEGGEGWPKRDADFWAYLMEWNRLAWPGQMAPDTPLDLNDGDRREIDQTHALKSENPLAAVWLRLARLQSVTLARKTIKARCVDQPLEESGLDSKATGVAFALRNAADYYRLSDAGNLSQRILNLYYGTMSFAIAEMLARPDGPTRLEEVESGTKQGHGLYTFDGASDEFKDIHVGALASGFFGTWVANSGVSDYRMSSKKAKAAADIPGLTDGSYITLEGLLARIPEIGDLYEEVFDAPNMWIRPVYIDEWNEQMGSIGGRPAERTYCLVIDASGRLSKAEVAAFPFNLSEVREINRRGRARYYKVAFDHPGHDTWHEALAYHKSPLGPSSLIKPIFGQVGDFRMICFVLLYALSIIVRYRPSLWRRLQEGDLDHVRALIETFLVTVERLLPQHFLASVTGNPIDQ